MCRWVVSVALLAVPVVAAAWTGPSVPEEMLASVPGEVLDAWTEREERIAALTREIHAARSALVTTDGPNAMDDARAMVRSELEVTRRACTRARMNLDAAQDESEAARGELKAARSIGDLFAVEEARELVSRTARQRAAAKRDLAAARRSRARARRAADDRLAVAAQAFDLPTDPADAGDGLPSITEEELVLLQAKRDLLAAELEREQAVAAIAGGAPLELAPFDEALERARADEASARRATHAGPTEDDDLEEVSRDPGQG